MDQKIPTWHQLGQPTGDQKVQAWRIPRGPGLKLPPWAQDSRFQSFEAGTTWREVPHQGRGSMSWSDHSVKGWCRVDPKADRLEAEQMQFTRYFNDGSLVGRQAGRL